MMTRAMMLVTMVLQLTLTSAVSAQDAAGFAGEWTATKESKSIASVKIVDAPSGRTVQAFGVCTPKPCDWGVVPFTVLEQRPKGSGPAVGIATWRMGTATRVMTFKLGEGSILIELYNVFSGARDQPSYFTVAELAGPARTPATRSTPGARR
jgi:hypothetical protein